MVRLRNCWSAVELYVLEVMRKSELDQVGPCVNLRVSAGLLVKLTLSSNAILSIILIILEKESFKLWRLTGLTAYVSVGLAN